MKRFSCLVLLCGAMPAMAQSYNDVASIDEIIVTATRVPESRVRYAGSVSRLNESVLDDLAVVHPAESLNQLASVNIQRGSGQEHLTAIRSPVLTGGAGAGSFLYLEDGVPLRAAAFANVNGLFEAGTEFASGMEVVKGPGSVLYGSNALHGLVNILSRPADRGVPAYIRLTANDDGYVGLSATARAGVVRTNLALTHDNGFRDDSGYDQQKVQIRLDDQWGAWTVQALASYVNLNQETAGFIRGPEAYKDPDIQFTNPNPEAYRDSWALRGYLRLERDVGDDGRLQITPYARDTEMEFLRHFVPGAAREKNGHHSFGVLSALYMGDWIAGLDVELTNGFYDEFQEGPRVFSYVQGAHYDYEVDNLIIAAYLQKDWQLSQKTTLTAGVRVDYADFDYDNKIDSGVFGRFKRVDDRSDDFWLATPKLALSHTINDRATLYGRLARGARVPQVSDLYSLQVNQEVGEIKEETLDSAELGLKGQWGGLRYDVSGYYMEKDNFFFRNSNGFNVVDGKTSHKGVEIETYGDINDFLSIRASASLAEHLYEFTDIVSSASSSIHKGDDVDTAPHTTAHVTLIAHLTPDWSGEVEWRHMGDYYTDPGNTAQYDGHDIWVVRTQYETDFGVNLFGRVDNLFDKDYADRADFAFGDERYFPGRPRTFFFGLSKTFF